MIACDMEDWNELVGILKETEERLTSLNVGDFDKEAERSRQSIQSFRTTAAMLGLGDLEKAGVELEKFLSCQVAATRSMDTVAVFGFAVGSLVEQMRNTAKESGTGGINLDEILDILGPAEGADFPPQDAAQPEAGVAVTDISEPAAGTDSIQEAEGQLELKRLGEVVKSWGGDLSIAPNGEAGGKFTLTFSGSAESLKRLERLFCSEDNASELEQTPAMSDSRIEKVISKGKEFMEAFSCGDMVKAQEILLALSDQQYQSGLYKEIGGVARGLHDSIRMFLHTLDPTLKEMVEDKIPDSGNRLEHMLELTEKAAITTLDHVEAMQDRLVIENEQVSRLQAIVGGLIAIGDPAGKKLGEGLELVGDLGGIIAQHRADLDAILTAQDYQDLSGQIILKITKLLKDLELRLVNMIRTFGVKVEAGKSKDELYGPAHEGREDSVHSQDEVDSLLAEFGF
ncbi:MAG: protein phosphatase CheZ [Syntrophobacteraceae bacterium]